MNRISRLFQEKKAPVLSIYFTAGYPKLHDTLRVLNSLQAAGADMVEIGMPFSDPLADGPVIQESSQQALKNGMSIAVLFEQLKECRNQVRFPIILMGYMNPVLQYGMDRFLKQCTAVGVDGLILPDLPLYEYETQYKTLFEQYDIRFIFLVTPETTEERLRQIDQLSDGFIYAVSSSSTTGKDKNWELQENYFTRLEKSRLTNPVLAGFGVKDKSSFDAACRHTQGAIIGTAFIRALSASADIQADVSSFIQQIKTK